MVEAHYNVIMPLVAQEAHTLKIRMVRIEERINVIKGDQFKEALGFLVPDIIEERDKLSKHIALLEATMRYLNIEFKGSVC